MKKILLGLLVLTSFSASAQLKFITQYGGMLDSAVFMTPYNTAIAAKQASLSGTGLVRMSGTTPSYDNSVYQTGNAAITVSATGDMTGTSSSSATAPAITLTLATVNSNVGSFGTATAVPTIVFNAKGLGTSVVNTPIAIAESQVTSLTSDLTSKQGTISFTTTGSGVATFSANALNIPTPITAPNLKFNEEATGAATTTITLANTPLAGTLKFSKNGVKLPAIKFSLTGAVVTLTDARVAADTFSSDYSY